MRPPGRWRGTSSPSAHGPPSPASARSWSASVWSSAEGQAPPSRPWARRSSAAAHRPSPPPPAALRRTSHHTASSSAGSHHASSVHPHITSVDAIIVRRRRRHHPPARTWPRTWSRAAPHQHGRHPPLPSRTRTSAAGAPGRTSHHRRASAAGTPSWTMTSAGQAPPAAMAGRTAPSSAAHRAVPGRAPAAGRTEPLHPYSVGGWGWGWGWVGHEQMCCYAFARYVPEATIRGQGKARQGSRVSLLTMWLGESRGI